MFKSILTKIKSIGRASTPKKKSKYLGNQPYLEEKARPFGKDELIAARKGYMYVTAAALSLQGDGQEDKDHWIEIPTRLKPIQPDPFIGSKGFQARVFLLHDKNNFDQIEALVIAYTGSQMNSIQNIWYDWIVADFLGGQSQHEQARELLKSLVAKYPNIHKVVVTGFSLGGALAAHVALHPDTSKYVSEAWTFNPSGRIYDMRPEKEKDAMANSDERDPRFWLVANYAEGARYSRTNFTHRYIRGFDWIPAPYDNFVNKIQLLPVNSIKGHFRYVLFRDLLWAAELDARINKIEPNEPLEIITHTHFV